MSHRFHRSAQKNGALEVFSHFSPLKYYQNMARLDRNRRDLGDLSIIRFLVHSF